MRRACRWAAGVRDGRRAGPGGRHALGRGGASDHRAAGAGPALGLHPGSGLPAPHRLEVVRPRWRHVEHPRHVQYRVLAESGALPRQERALRRRDLLVQGLPRRAQRHGHGVRPQDLGDHGRDSSARGPFPDRDQEVERRADRRRALLAFLQHGAGDQHQRGRREGQEIRGRGRDPGLRPSVPDRRPQFRHHLPGRLVRERHLRRDRRGHA